MKTSFLSNHSLSTPKLQMIKSNLITIFYLSFLSMLFTPVIAQPSVTYNNLIFDPVAIQISNPNSNPNISDTIIELTSLPNSSTALNSPYLITQPETLSIPTSNIEPIPAVSPDNSIVQYLQSIKQLETNSGPYDPNLIQQLTSLASAYQDQHDLTSSLAVYDRAIHITRVNNGLFSSLQAPIIHKVIQALLSNGDFFSANKRYENLFYLQSRIYNPDSPEMLTALFDYAEWNIFAFKSHLSTPLSSSNKISRLSFSLTLLESAYRIDKSITKYIKNNYSNEDKRLPDIEKKLAFTNYFFANTLNHNSALGMSTRDSFFQSQSSLNDQSIMSGVIGYRRGRDALKRRIDQLKGTHNLPQDTISMAIVDLADWYQRFNKPQVALNLYKEANALLLQQHSNDKAEELLRPLIPTSIPSFIAPSYSRAANNIPEDLPLNYKGYIDVEFTISRFGLARNITTLGSSNNGNDIDINYIESLLLYKLKGTRFRPLLLDSGKTFSHELTQLRYYFTYY